ncbi:MAG: dehydratase [Gammaproteobacteria bacterium]|nr:dehydratase [Gammaproteobacteria bacterium]
MYKINNIDDAKALEGKELGISDWVVVDQDKIEKFAIATGDDQWIHLDQNRAKRELPDGKTIAHGYLTLSLVPALTRNFIEVKGLKQMINFGSNKVRFYSVVNEGDRVRARGTLMEAKQRGSMIQLLSKITVEVENKTKPACMVEMLVFLVMK